MDAELVKLLQELDQKEASWLEELVDIAKRLGPKAMTRLHAHIMESVKRVEPTDPEGLFTAYIMIGACAAMKRLQAEGMFD